ncbi:hypothetical protein HYH03_007849 [Edaphochlamys debaryana]|uniref:SGNH hydrolase-type esterase domain-containing protein n=1 Tax=Edaphochlamys debaryana TaxID=47281 RepID=A0A835Y3C5_9CHLO|nr:hypothetical protein HYH03_007849 [Edaphochlamys debaryana]|eukprot:KAG2493913.1 hypothetical protein HYH03_007849 [Edaphochlamys debaryana]
MCGTFGGLSELERTKHRPDLEWSWDHRFATLEVNKQPVSTLLSTLLDYRFSLPRVQLQRGVVMTGAASRLRRLVKDLMLPPEGHRGFKVSAIGGSVTWGQGTSQRGVTDWFSTVGRWMVSAFPRANITARNGCTPGIPTQYMIMCLELSVDPDVDLVFIEYTLNDGTDEMLFGNKVVINMERLVRRVMALPGKPAVVFMQIPTHGMGSYPRDHPKYIKDDAYRPFYEAAEDAEGALAQYYDLQYLSLRTALYRLAQFKEQPGFRWEDTFSDFHPGDQGHTVMADLAVRMIQRTALGLLIDPFDVQDADLVNEQLPPPMYPGNVPPSNPMCVVGELFSRGMQVMAYFHHLRSYEHMGMASISCVSGCTCVPVTVDALCSQQWSQVYLAGISVSQARECVMELQVLNETKSGEHKFKVSGLVVSEKAGIDFVGAVFGGTGRPFSLGIHNGAEEQATVSSQSMKGGPPSPSPASRQRLLGAAQRGPAGAGRLEGLSQAGAGEGAGGSGAAVLLIKGEVEEGEPWREPEAEAPRFRAFRDDPLAALRCGRKSLGGK